MLSFSQPILRASLGLIFVGFFAGCESTPVKPATKAVAPAMPAPAAAPAAKVVMPHVVTAQARAAAERLMESQQAHEMVNVSAFSGYPQFTAQNWSGLVLSSKVSTQSLAHTTDFRVFRIEIHPLTDGRVRVWLEIVNTSLKPVFPEVACQFTPEDDDKNAKFATLAELPPGKHAVAYFESRENAPYSYSILARKKRN